MPLLCSEQLRRRHASFELVQKVETKATHEIKIAIYINEKKPMERFLKYVTVMDNKEAFFDALQNDRNACAGGRRWQSILKKDIEKLRDPNDPMDIEQFLAIFD